MKKLHHRLSLYCLGCFCLVLILSGCRFKGKDAGVNSGEEKTVREISEDPNPEEDTTEGRPAESVPASDIPFSIEEEVAYMFSGDSWKIPFRSVDEGIEINAASLSWTSSDPDTVSVDPEGRVKALQEGSAVITCKNLTTEESLCINVYDQFGGGDYWDLPVRRGD